MLSESQYKLINMIYLHQHYNGGLVSVYLMTSGDITSSYVREMVIRL